MFFVFMYGCCCFFSIYFDLFVTINVKYIRFIWKSSGLEAEVSEIVSDINVPIKITGRFITCQILYLLHIIGIVVALTADIGTAV